MMPVILERIEALAAGKVFKKRSIFLLKMVLIMNFFAPNISRDTSHCSVKLNPI